ncbi:hypothetical protein M378DRAFT_639369 [Amanita muscaria Koide BX008]|uniref:Uncharacterized protein n=1 Tax=Amanita muscaria (strain Koide BX008) TaxID=946122 RepID=A0A0C2SMW8_AMAMK|nr:hypothetical protein M378DRAFT_639369 [Amanita muscaria Koide BX008]
MSSRQWANLATRSFCINSLSSSSSSSCKYLLSSSLHIGSSHASMTSSSRKVASASSASSSTPGDRGSTRRKIPLAPPHLHSRHWKGGGIGRMNASILGIDRCGTTPRKA